MKFHVAHLVRKNDVFYFRMRLSRSLSDFLGLTEIKRSLHSSDLKTAARLCILLRTDIKNIIRRHKVLPMAKDEFISLIDKHFEKILEETRGRYLQKTYASPDEMSENVMELEEAQNDLRHAATLRDYIQARPIADEILSAVASPPAKDSIDYLKICDEIMKRLYDLYEAEKKMVYGDYGAKLSRCSSATAEAAPLNNIAIPATAPQTTSSTEPRMKELFERYMDEKIKAGSWEDKTARGNKGMFELFLEILGDVPVSSITHQQLLACRDNVLMKLPTHRQKCPEFKGLSYQEVIRINTRPSMSQRTINEKNSMLSSFLDWCVKHEYATRNVAKGLELKIRTRADQERDIYEQDDLRRLLDELKSISKSKTPARYWIPLIALYSGMRMGEICQLYIKDIIDQEGIACFNIAEENPDQKVKSKAGIRIVPVHPVLVSLGFMEYVEKMKHKNADGRLWPELIASRGTYAEHFSRWYSRLNKKLVESGKKSFHSFRHSFATNLKHHKVEELVIAELMGHANESMTTGRYGKRYPAKTLLDAIIQLDYGLDVISILTPALTATVMTLPSNEAKVGVSPCTATFIPQTPPDNIKSK